MKTKLFITGLAIMALTTMVSAQNSSDQDPKVVKQSAQGNYIDEDKNGVCDFYEANVRHNGTGRRMGNAHAGNCPGGMAAGQGRGKVIAQGRGMGPGKGRGAAPGGKNFIDENKNGICDLRETPTGK